MAINFSVCLLGNIFILPSHVKGSFARYRILGWWFLSFCTLKIFHTIVSNKKSTVNYIDASLYVMNPFSLDVFKVCISLFDFELFSGYECLCIYHA